MTRFRSSALALRLSLLLALAHLASSAHADGRSEGSTSSPTPEPSLEIEDDLVLGGSIFLGDELLLNADTAHRNFGVGIDALRNVTPDAPMAYDGILNTAVGHWAMRNTTSGRFNTSVGSQSLYYNEAGSNNTMLGSGAGFLNLDGSENTAVGMNALLNNTSGAGNTVVGRSAMYRANGGAANVAIGSLAGSEITVANYSVAIGWQAEAGTAGDGNIAIGAFSGGIGIGDYNIFLGSPAGNGDDATIRIGDTARHTATFLAGVRGTTVANGISVLVGSLGRLGTVSSSRRFKEEIHGMSDTSAGLLTLRPVTFRYTEDAAGDGPRPVEYGLIAEEVAEIYPELVAYDAEGKPDSVRYHVLPAMLLNELQRERRERLELERKLDALLDRLRTLEQERESRAKGN